MADKKEQSPKRGRYVPVGESGKIVHATLLGPRGAQAISEASKRRQRQARRGK